MKSFPETIAAIIGALIGALATAYLASGTTLEFRQRITDSYFVVPDQIKSDLKIEHKGNTLTNISVVEIAIYNRSWWSDASEVTLHFRIQASPDRPLPTLISKDFSGPKRLGKIGISELKTEEEKVISYGLKNLKRSKDNDYYLASFIFEGAQPPEVSVTTNEKNLDIEPYSERREVITAAFAVVAFYSIFIGVLLYLSELSAKKARERFGTNFRKSLLEKGNGITSDNVTAILDVYNSVVQARNGRLSRFISGLFSRNGV